MAEGVAGSVEPLWQVAHRELLGLARTRAGLDVEEGHWLVLARRSNINARLGMGSFIEYVERVFGYSPRLTMEKLRVAEALEGLPATAKALESGEVSWSAVRELTRVATAETERKWLEAARGKTARDVERLVSGRRPGSAPADPVEEAARRHVVRFEVTGDVLATFREAVAKIRRDSDGPLDDEQVLLLMARRVLGGPADEGRASYQVAMTVCEQCRSAWQQGRGEQVRVDSAVAEMASCDAQHVGTVGDTHVGMTKAAQEIPPAIRRAVLRRDHGQCRFPGCRHGTFVDIHQIRLRSEGGGHDPDGLITLCSAHHRAIHSGVVVVLGSASKGLEFRHADGSAYGTMSALADTHVGTGVEGLVREALRTLTEKLARAS